MHLEINIYINAPAHFGIDSKDRQRCFFFITERYHEKKIWSLWHKKRAKLQPAKPHTVIGCLVYIDKFYSTVSNDCVCGAKVPGQLVHLHKVFGVRICRKGTL